MEQTQTQPEYGPALALVEQAVQALGFDRISPESLTALKARSREVGWWSTGNELGVEGYKLAAAYNDVMAGLRALLGPAP